MVQPASKRLVTEEKVGNHVLTHITSPGATKDALDAAYALKGEAGGSSAAAASPALGMWTTQLVLRQTRAFPIVCLGDSNAEGYNLASEADSYPNKLAGILQSAFPSGLGSETTVQKIRSGTPTVHTVAGIHVYNGGIGGFMSHEYLGLSVLTNVKLIQPGAILHIIGANDWSTDVAPETYKTNVQSKINTLDTDVTAPHIHVLIHVHERADANVNPATYAWADYGAKLKEIADANPSKVMFVDLAGTFKATGFPGTDPLDIGQADLIHLTPTGNSLLAQLVFRSLNGELAGAATAAAASDTIAPSALTGLAAGTPTSTTIPLSWTAATDNAGVTGYEYSLNGTTWTATGSTGTTYTVTGLNAGTAYTIQVRAFDAAGNKGTAASVTATTAASTDTTAPTAPTNLAGTPTDTTTALSWTAATDNVGVTGYRVSSDNGATWITSAVTGTSYTVTGLTASTSYTFAVAARDAAGNWSTNATLVKSTTAAVTTYAVDSFTRADSASLGSTETGAFAWTAVDPARWSIAGNRLASAAHNTPYTVPNDCLVNTGQADGTLLITRVTNPTQTGFVFRVSADNTTGYLIWNDGTAWKLMKRTAAGSYTQLGSSAVARADGDVISIVLNGSSITCKVNGATIITVTDASYTGTRHGAWANSSAVATTFDDFRHTSATV